MATPRKLVEIFEARRAARAADQPPPSPEPAAEPQPTRDAGLGLGLSGLPSALLSSLGRIGGGGGGVGLTSSSSF